VVIENDRLQMAHQHQGRAPTVIRLKEYSTHNKTPLYLADPDSGNYEFDFFLGNRTSAPTICTSRASVRERTKCVFTAATTDPAKFLRDHLPLDSVTYFMDTTSVVGVDRCGPTQHRLPTGSSPAFSNEKYRDGELQKMRCVLQVLQRRPQLPERDRAGQKKLEGRTNWVAFKQDFFTVALISEKASPAADRRSRSLPLKDVHPHQALQREALLREGARQPRLRSP
jgi:hypothetical protein